jgi:hypothetical protein
MSIQVPDIKVIPGPEISWPSEIYCRHPAHLRILFLFDFSIPAGIKLGLTHTRCKKAYDKNTFYLIELNCLKARSRSGKIDGYSVSIPNKGGLLWHRFG